MSHAVTTKIEINTTDELKVLSCLEQQIKDLNSFWQIEGKETIKNFYARLDKLRRQLKKINNTFGKETVQDGTLLERSKELLEYQKLQDNLTKRIANLKNGNLFHDIFNKHLNSQENNLNDFVVENGYMAYLSIQKLEQKNMPINVENLEKEMVETRNEEIQKNVKNDIEQNIADLIDNINLPSSQKNELYKVLDDVNTPQQAMDTSALIKSLEVASIRNKEFAAYIKSILKNIDFDVCEETFTITNEQVLVTNIVAYNPTSKTISIKIHSDGKFEYDLGNYEGHMCEADSEKFRSDILQKYNMSAPRITRKTSNSRPRLKAAKIKERNI